MTLVLVGLTACPAALREPAVEAGTREAMGTTFSISVATPDRERARLAIDAAFGEIDRVERLLSEWMPGSEISRLNRIGTLRVGSELLEVVTRSLAISETTGGAFDVTVAACSALWSFAEPRIPDDGELAACLGHVGPGRVTVDADTSTVTLVEGTRIGISGIGKGYGIDAAVRILEEHGLRDYVVDGGGDIRVRGRRGDRPWRVGIAHPRERGRLFAEIELTGGSIVTSGDYMQFFERGGRRYHHILDPRTGRPARRALAATVIAPTATDADALATGLFVLGPAEGTALAESLPGVEALIFAPDGTTSATTGFPLP